MKTCDLMDLMGYQSYWTWPIESSLIYLLKIVICQFAVLVYQKVYIYIIYNYTYYDISYIHEIKPR